MRWGVLVCAFLWSSITLANTSRVPPGFELAIEEQELLSEVVFMGVSIGLHKVKVSSESFVFLEPQLLYAHLQKVFSVKPEFTAELQSYLTSSLKRNDSKSCVSGYVVAGCGYIKSERVAGIYNDNNASILLFANPDFFDLSEGKRYFAVTQSNVENGYVQQQRLNYLYTDDYRTGYLVGVGSLALDDKSYAVLDWEALYSESVSAGYRASTLNLNGLYVRRDMSRDVYAQLGKMSTSDLSSKLGGLFSFSFFPPLNLEGIRLGKTFAYESTKGSATVRPLIVVLVNSARVDVYKAGKLLSSQYLRAGSNVLDTDQFPPGDYPVQLKIYEGDRLVRTSEDKVSVSRAFAKDNQSAWFLQLGKIDPQFHAGYDDDPWVVQSGYGFSLFDNSYLSAVVGAQAQTSYAEVAVEYTKGIDLLSSDVNLKYTSFMDFKGARGDSQRISINGQGVSTTVTHDNLVSPACQQLRSWQPEYFGCFETLSAYFGFAVGNLSFTSGYTRSMSLGSFFDGLAPQRNRSLNRATENYQVMINRSYVFADFNLLLGAGLFRDIGLYDSKWADQGFFMSFSLSTNQSNHLDLSLSNRFQRASLSGSISNTDLAIRKQWDDQSREVALNVSEYLASKSGEKSDSLNIAAEARLSHGRYYGSLSQTAVSNGATQQTIRSMSGAYSSSLAVSSLGVNFGPYGQGQPSGAVLAQSSGNDLNSQFSLSAGGYRSQVSSGQNALLPVTQYQRTLVEVNPLTPIDASTFDQAFDDSDAELFLLPGKVNLRHISTQRTTFAFISQFTLSGKRLIPVKFSGVESASVYPEGGAAIEIKTGQTFKLHSDGGITAVCTVPAPKTDQVTVLEVLACKPSSN